MYDEQFFLDEARVAAESAAVVVPWLKKYVDWTSNCIDIGGGTGEWSNTFYGVFCVTDYHCPSTLNIDLYAPADPQKGPRLYLDITNGVDCTGWDLAICLEVAEHLPPESAVPLVAGLAKAETVLFSAATPDQPGVNHINCQPHEYWYELFGRYGMTPEFIGDKFEEPVADFYRRNMYLYRES